MTGREAAPPRATADRLAVRRGEFVHWRRRLLSLSWLWFAALVIGGTVLVAPWRGRGYPDLSAGEVAPSDIVIRREVTLPDPESTEQKRRRASLEVLPVYVLDSEADEQLEAKLGRLFAEGRRDRSGRLADLAARLSEAAGLRVSEGAAASFRDAGFAAELEAILKEVVAGLYRQGIAADRAELLQSSARGVVVRTAERVGERVEFDVYRFLEAGAPLAEVIEQRLGAEPAVVRASRRPLATFLSQTLVPNLVLDRGETLARRLRAAAAVEEVVVRLPRGRVLVRRGDEVTPQTARLLGALATRSASTPSLLPWLGSVLIAALLSASWYLYLRRESPSPEELHGRFGGTAVLMLLSLLLARGAAFLAGGVAASVMRDPFGNVEIYLPALPHAAGPVLAGLMYGVPTAVVFAVVQTVLVSLTLGGEISLALYALVASVAGAFASQRLKERNVLSRVGLVTAGINAVTIAGLTLVHGTLPEGTVMAAQVVAAFTGGLFAAALASFLLPVFESLTGTVTDIRLLELSNPNLPLLKRLSIEAPGTFQHSVAMANLAEAAAEAIGANPLLARVCCFYHDIGKLAKPTYFVENQRGENPHDHLSPWMSALVVSNHVKAGLELARQYRLPEPVRDAITTHHGNKLIRYFYARAKEQENPDRGEVSDTEFRYPGPRPVSKEMGIIHLADAVEAASRTLQDPTPGKIQGMIDQIVKHALEDGQLDDCELTLKDIEKISAAFFWVLTNTFHNRVDYPGFDFNRRRRD
ncbi:MAG: HD family phosphohydrolase [Acidobacteriota bacterium]